MSDDILQEIRCPNCQSPIKLDGRGQAVNCEACNSQFILQGHLCPQCHTYHRQETAFCGRCGTSLTRVCGRCYTSNWTGDEYCCHCGQAMDILDLVTHRHREARYEQQEQRRQNIARVKQQEEESSRKRMAELMEMERLRIEELKRRLIKERARQRTMLMLVLGFGALFFVLILAYTLLGG
ncbi:MAG: hypothetical protein KA314_16975 [Chloroflexi bacterium]|nr:hypothetical protein [Chloroflexota bacterium]MBP8057526.1 hypothetical protein [Chloroflexota bacterium]